MYKNKLLVILMFFIFFICNIIPIVNAGGDITLVYDTTDLNTDSGDDRIVMDSNGHYWVVSKNDAVNDYYLHKSIDEGVTWTYVTKFDEYSANCYQLDIVIDSDDIIHIFFTEGFGGTSYLYYHTYDIDSTTMSGRVTLDTDTDGNAEFPDGGLAIAVDWSNNLYVFYYNINETEISFRKWNEQLDMWGSEREAYQLPVGVTDTLIGLSADVDASRDAYCSFIRQNTTVGNDLMVVRLDNSDDDFDVEIIRALTIDVKEDYTDIAIDSSGVNHIVYSFNVTDSDIAVNYTYGNFGGTWYDERLYFSDTNNQIDPSISISNDDVVHVVWVGENGDTAHPSILGKRGNYNDWSDIQFFAYDSSDNLNYPSLFYQNFPSDLNAVTGIIGICDNTTEDQVIFYDYGIILNDFVDEYDGCENDYFEIIKWSGNEIDINVTAEFEIVKSGYSLARYQIINLDTDTVVQTDGGLGFNEDRLTVYYKPLWSHGLGNYSIDVKYYAEDDWNLECDFTVIDGSVSLDSNWSVYTDKSTYSINDSVDVFVVVPVDEIFSLHLYRVGITNPIFQRNNEIGTGSTQIYLNEYYLGTGNVDYRLKLINESGIVKNQTIFNVLPSGYVPPGEGEWYGLPFWLPYLIGVFLTLFVTMSPLIIGTYITRNSKIEKINIPPLLYVGFFFMGLVTSVVIGFLPSWLPFVILFAMIVYFAVTWLAGKQASVQGE